MTDHLFKRFANRIETVKKLLESNEDFREICSDYEEICTWIAFQEKYSVPRSQIERARETSESLEKEITRALERINPAL